MLTRKWLLALAFLSIMLFSIVYYDGQSEDPLPPPSPPGTPYVDTEPKGQDSWLDILFGVDGEGDIYADFILYYVDGSYRIIRIPHFTFTIQSIIDVNEDREIDKVRIVIYSNLELNEYYERVEYRGAVEVVVRLGDNEEVVIERYSVESTYENVKSLKKTRLFDLTLTSEQIISMVSHLVDSGRTFTFMFRIPKTGISFRIYDSRLSQPWMIEIPYEHKYAGVTMYLTGHFSSTQPPSPLPPSLPSPPPPPQSGGGNRCVGCPVIFGGEVVVEW